METSPSTAVGGSSIPLIIPSITATQSSPPSSSSGPVTYQQSASTFPDSSRTDLDGGCVQEERSGATKMPAILEAKEQETGAPRNTSGNGDDGTVEIGEGYHAKPPALPPKPSRLLTVERTIPPNGGEDVVCVIAKGTLEKEEVHSDSLQLNQKRSLLDDRCGVSSPNSSPSKDTTGGGVWQRTDERRQSGAVNAMEEPDLNDSCVEGTAPFEGIQLPSEDRSVPALERISSWPPCPGLCRRKEPPVISDFQYTDMKPGLCIKCSTAMPDQILMPRFWTTCEKCEAARKSHWSDSGSSKQSKPTAASLDPFSMGCAGGVTANPYPFEHSKVCAPHFLRQPPIPSKAVFQGPVSAKSTGSNCSAAPPLPPKPAHLERCHRLPTSKWWPPSFESVSAAAGSGTSHRHVHPSRRESHQNELFQFDEEEDFLPDCDDAYVVMKPKRHAWQAMRNLLPGYDNVELRNYQNVTIIRTPGSYAEHKP